MICDGRTVSRTTYSALFAVLGTYWGAGDGSTTFALPPTPGRAAIGPGTVVDTNGVSTTFSFTQKTGAVSNVIAKVNLPNYNLVTDTQGSHSHGGATVTAGPWGVGTDAQGSHSHGGQTGGNNVDHTHTGYTNYLGDHGHVTAYVAIAGINGAGGGPGSSVTAGTGPSTFGAGAHQHDIQTYGASAAHLHGISADGYHAHNVTITAHAHGITADGSHAHNISLGGSSTPFSVLPPVIVVTKIIYAGKQAATTVMADSAVSLLADMEASDDLAAIRQELAELRAILAPPRSQRVLHSPSRGPH
jgi:microcystin-dependent protein